MERKSGFSNPRTRLTVISSWTNRDKLAFPTVKLIRETNSRRRLILMLLDASGLFTT